MILPQQHKMAKTREGWPFLSLNPGDHLQELFRQQQFNKLEPKKLSLCPIAFLPITNVVRYHHTKY